MIIFALHIIFFSHYLGKRSADSEAAPVAEAKADADADPW